MDTTVDEAERAAFKEKLRSLQFGYTYGKRAFHDTTIGEKRREIVESAAAQGRQIEPVGTRWV